MDDLIRITKKITFGDLRQGRKTSIDVYEEQIKSWLIKPLKDLAKDKKNNFENGYAMFALELLFLNLMVNIWRVILFLLAVQILRLVLIHF
jgi:hypothetical protein